MKIGTIVRSKESVGVIIEKLPNGRVDCVFGNETKRHILPLTPKLLSPVGIIDLTPQEHEDVLHLMQALVFLLVENNEPF